MSTPSGNVERKVLVRPSLEPERGSTDAVVQARELSSQERAFRAAKALLLLWVLAAAFVPIPILHFIFVPSFLIAGPVFAWKRGSATAVVESGALTCARCSQPVAIQERIYGWPAEVYCKACGVSLSVVPA